MTRTRAKIRALQQVVTWLDEELASIPTFGGATPRDQNVLCFEIRELRHDLHERAAHLEISEEAREAKRGLARR